METELNTFDGRRRCALPDALELPFLDAVYWVAFGLLHDGTTLDTGEQALLVAIEDAFEDWCRSQPGDFSSRRADYPLTGRQKYGLARYNVEELWPKRRLLDKAGSRFLRLSIRAARLSRRFEKQFNRAEAQLIEAARSGRLSVRAKSEKHEAIPVPLDPAYFRNPVAINLLTGELELSWESLEFLDDGFDWREANLKRFSPLVSIRDLRAILAEPKGPVGDAPALKAARRFMSSRSGQRVIQRELLDFLKSEGFQVGKHRKQRLFDALRVEFPEAFRPGAPPKK